MAATQENRRFSRSYGRRPANLFINKRIVNAVNIQTAEHPVVNKRRTFVMFETQRFKKSISTMEAPVATITSTMLFFTISLYACMHPAAPVLPRASTKPNYLLQHHVVNVGGAPDPARKTTFCGTHPPVAQHEVLISICSIGVFKRSFCGLPHLQYFFDYAKNTV